METNRAKRFSVFQSQTRPTTALPPNSKRGGATPSKSEAKGQEPQEKVKFTAQQQLDIIERLERGDFVRGAGLQQFYEEPGSFAAGPSTRKNLLSEFDKLQVSGPSSMAAPPLSSTNILEATDRDDASDDMNPCINLMEYGLHEHNPDAYLCMDLMDRIIVHYQMNVRDLMTLGRVRSEGAFAELVPPQQLINLFCRMDEISRTVKKFMRKPEMEQARLFLPPGTFSGQRGKEDGKNQEAKNRIQVDVLEQENFFAAVKKIPGWMEWIEGLLKKLDGEKFPDERTAKLKEVIAKMLRLVNELEDGLVRMENNNAAHGELCDKILDCEEDDATTTTSSEYSPFSDVSPSQCVWSYGKK